MNLKDPETSYWVKTAIVIAIALIGAFDLMLLFRYGRKATISCVIAESCKNFPMLPYILAFGMGAFLYHLLTAAD
jgi:hypothetical protein